MGGHKGKTSKLSSGPRSAKLDNEKGGVWVATKRSRTGIEGEVKDVLESRMWKIKPTRAEKPCT